jgi:AcrR family transcriptional regulator
MALRGLSDSAGLRERKKAATQSLLRTTALELFAKKSFSEVSVDEIATTANVSRSTFFRYFGSKEAVLFDEIDESGDVFLSHLDSRPATEAPWRAFEAAMMTITSQSSGDQDLDREQRAVDELLRSDPALLGRRLALLENLSETIANVFARRAGRDEPRSEDRLAASTCMAASEEVGRLWRESPGVDTIEVIQKVFSTLRSF